MKIKPTERKTKKEKRKEGRRTEKENTLNGFNCSDFLQNLKKLILKKKIKHLGKLDLLI
jgi:uncharacterized protein YaiI (UPF0178 family)